MVIKTRNKSLFYETYACFKVFLLRYVFMSDVCLPDMLLSLKMLFVNASLVALILGFCCDAYLYAGYVTFMSKYLEIQFNLSAYAANIFSGQSLR